jgi:hypothetical protein
MPTLVELTDRVYRDLADEAKEVFSVIQIEDFVRAGIVDLNRVAPTDSAYELALVADPITGIVTQFIYDIPIELPYRVEVQRISDGYALPIPEAVEGQTSSTGWTFMKTATGGTIEFPAQALMETDPDLFRVRIHGYMPRPLPYDTDPDPLVSPETGLGPEEEYSVRAYAKQAGYDLLAHDRSLFAQWQGQTNNTDVSPTQMMQMAQNSKQEWDRQRGLIRVVRRYW